ncbi:hypothetical protein BV898_04844 [Hypsibius exemplaris]|uniref:BTB domain-containing protein n=1 Tax=Hypsibius exemplaris TaxID=2072580 RepID=A0A1W0X0U6_HYPEX|nr:hypothetical protein BV898_04844 [Hypsibius exemplaris]
MAAAVSPAQEPVQVTCAEFILSVTVPNFSSVFVMTEPAEQRKQFSNCIRITELGMKDADGTFYLAILYSETPDKPKRFRISVGRWATTKGLFTVDVVLRVPNAKWERIHRDVVSPGKLQYQIVAQEHISQADLLDPMKMFLTKDSLTITAHVQLTVGSRPLGCPDRMKETALANYSALLSDKSRCDFTLLSADGEEFPVHRSIISCHSPVLAAMLTHDTAENQTGRCVMANITGSALKALLDYIYHGKVELVAATADTLLTAADMYELLPLKNLCLELMSRDLTLANAARLLVLADQHDCAALKATVLAFLKRGGNTVEFVQNGGVSELLSYGGGRGQLLVEEVMTAVAAPVGSKKRTLTDYWKA